MNSRRQQGDWHGLALLGGGIALVTLVIGGYAVGHLIDRALGTGHTWGIIGLVLGAIIGFWECYRIAAVIVARQPAPSAENAAPPGGDEDDEREQD